MRGVSVHAPLINPKQIVDVGCGTGVITCYLGERFPDAIVLGIDIHPVVPPTLREKPDNVSFVQGDFFSLASKDDRFARASTDLVFNRLLVCGMTDWKRYVETAVGMLRPGGWLEVQEVEDRWYVGAEEVVGQEWDWLKAYYAALQAKKLDPYCARKLESWMRDAGMATVEVQRFPWPFAQDQRHMYQRLLPRVLDGQGHSDERIQARVAESWSTTDLEGLYKNFRVTLGRKDIGISRQVDKVILRESS